MTIDVSGNFAALNIEIMRGGLWQNEVCEFIEERPGAWCIRDDEADRGFIQVRYPEPTEAQAAGEPEPEADAQPAVGGQEAEKRPVPKKPIEDPDKLFRISQVNLRHIEEDAYKVFGMRTRQL